MKGKCLLVLVCFVSLVSGNGETGESRVVRVTQGAIQGYKEKGNNYFSFYGIPYATAPTGPLKFKAPLPGPVWLNTLEATNKGIICPQSPMIKNILKDTKRKVDEQENCLTANVYVPDTKEEKLPVVVYIHGGAFQLGFGDMLVHDPLLKSGKIIEVTFNYRLGAHGFLCLGTEDIPGNAGMKDQVAALRWVQQNIAQFGGNPDDVTIAGYSAGSVSVELLTLSPSARGLFHKAILESGAGVGVWAAQIDPLENAKEYAKLLNFENVDDVYALEEFYKTTTLDVLLVDPFINRMDSTFVFVPCVERESTEDSFLTDTPVNIIKSGDYSRVPSLIGFGNMEGIFRLPLYEEWKDKMNSNFSFFLPADLEFSNKEERENIAKEIKEFYFGDKPVSMAMLISFVDYFTDVLFAYPIMRSVNLNLQAGSASLYLYQYSYVDENRPLPYNVYGADHCAQSLAISKSIYIEESATVSDNYATVKELLADIWVNFITTGKPVSKESDDFPSGWPAITTDNAAYMELHLSPELRKKLLKKRIQFWDRIYNKYYRGPTAPPTPTSIHSEL